MTDTKGPYSLYKILGKYGDTQTMLPLVEEDNGQRLLQELFEAIKRGETLQIMDRSSNKPTTVTIRNIDEDRRYIASLFSEMSGVMYFHIKNR